MPINMQIICENSIAGEQNVNTFAAVAASGVSPLTQALADDVENEFRQLYGNSGGGAIGTRGLADLRTNDITLTRVVVREILAGNAPGVFFEYSTNESGDEAGDTLPLQLCCVATLQTAQAGRRGRGRVFFGGFGENEVAETAGSGQWTNNTVSQVLQAIQDLNTRLEAAVPTPVTLAVWSRANAAFYPVTSSRVTSKVFTQRRRSRRGPTSTFDGGPV